MLSTYLHETSNTDGADLCPAVRIVDDLGHAGFIVRVRFQRRLCMRAQHGFEYLICFIQNQSLECQKTKMLEGGLLNQPLR